MPVNRNGDNMLDRLDTDGNSLMSKQTRSKPRVAKNQSRFKKDSLPPQEL